MCQHGEIECNANIYHACCIEAIDEPKILIDVIACMIRNNLLPKEAMQKVSVRVDYTATGKHLYELKRFVP